jgi:hypothetical protein
MKYALTKALLLLGTVFLAHAADSTTTQAQQLPKYETERIACLRGCLTKCKQDEPLISCQECQFMCVPRARINKKTASIKPLTDTRK